MKIVSWNVNGLRATNKNGFFLPFVDEYKPEILCLQETKSWRVQLPFELKNVDGYLAYFAECYKKGYSGVGLYTKFQPIDIQPGFGIHKFDEEGRTIMADYGDFIIFNIYFPNGGQGPHRLEYKLEFYDTFLEILKKLLEQGKKIVICGDVNTAHTECDLARPKENENNTGFLPQERAWIDRLLEAGFIDTYRHLHPKSNCFTAWERENNAYTYRDMKTGARARNVGWRIDYFFISKNLGNNLKDAFILDKVMGSDHCPIGIELQL